MHILVDALLFERSVCVSHLSDLLTHQCDQPDVEQQLRRGGPDLEVDHYHHGKQEEEGEVGHNVPVELDLWGAVQAAQFGPAVQRLYLLQPDGSTKVHTQPDSYLFKIFIFLGYR